MLKRGDRRAWLVLLMGGSGQPGLEADICVVLLRYVNDSREEGIAASSRVKGAWVPCGDLWCGLPVGEELWGVGVRTV